MVSGSSPEAFEETIWKHFWPDHYQADRITPWTHSTPNQEFDEFLASHIRKVIAVRRGSASVEMRYLSKNNANISRLASMPRAFSAAKVIVPFREPIQHAASMLTQHRRFLRIHEEDDFVRTYMEGIGHYEFGKGLRPVDFDGWMQNSLDPNDLEFWVRYWIAAYQYVLRHTTASVLLVSNRSLTEAPQTLLPWLADAIHIPTGRLSSQADRVHPPRHHDVLDRDLSPEARREASELYEILEETALARQS